MYNKNMSKTGVCSMSPAIGAISQTLSGRYQIFGVPYTRNQIFGVPYSMKTMYMKLFRRWHSRTGRERKLCSCRLECGHPFYVWLAEPIDMSIHPRLPPPSTPPPHIQLLHSRTVRERRASEAASVGLSQLLQSACIYKVVWRCGAHLAGAISLKPKPELSGLATHSS
jgi:hypothetical protein